MYSVFWAVIVGYGVKAGGTVLDEAMILGLDWYCLLS